jgi:hypothetical protein
MCKRLICKRIAETRDEAKDILGVAVRGAESVPSACPRIFPHTGQAVLPLTSAMVLRYGYPRSMGFC